ncbi:MAG: transporter [Proteobacteria bacterium]|nr:transporter [Pseudomonadota bacterium]
MTGTHLLRRAWPAWLALLCLETLCQIALKSAGLDNPDFDFSPTAFAHALATPWAWVAIGCYVGAFAVWMTILRKSTLSAAFTTSAIVFVAVMFASWLVFGEHIGYWQLVGCAIIVGGILALGADDAESGAG